MRVSVQLQLLDRGKGRTNEHVQLQGEYQKGDRSGSGASVQQVACSEHSARESWSCAYGGIERRDRTVEVKPTTKRHKPRVRSQTVQAYARSEDRAADKRRAHWTPEYELWVRRQTKHNLTEVESS
jgi:hypothetical protein